MSLKVIPGIFAIFYHYASGKYSARKASDLAIFFICGAETLPAIIFVIFNFLLNALVMTNLNFEGNVFSITTATMALALAFCFLFFYFQKSHGTKLFISRKTANSFLEKSKMVKNRSDAYTLGFTAGLPELIFTLPLYFIVFIEISESYILPSICAPLLLLFILLTITPLCFLYAYFRNGNNLANFARLRTKNKTFFRLFIPLLYIILGVLLIISRIYL